MLQSQIESDSRIGHHVVESSWAHTTHNVEVTLTVCACHRHHNDIPGTKYILPGYETLLFRCYVILVFGRSVLLLLLYTTTEDILDAPHRTAPDSTARSLTLKMSLDRRLSSSYVHSRYLFPG